MVVHESTRLKIITWKANSVQPKKLEFFDFLLKNSIDIAVINETHLKSGTEFSHPNYVCYRLISVMLF
jgi:exonuclease III